MKSRVGISSRCLFRKKRDMVVARGFAVAKHVNISFLQLNLKTSSEASFIGYFGANDSESNEGVVHKRFTPLSVTLTRDYRQESLIRENQSPRGVAKASTRPLLII
jgi:hypothetical protein